MDGWRASTEESETGGQSTKVVDDGKKELV
jgi:hypothetical protein